MSKDSESKVKSLPVNEAIIKPKQQRSQNTQQKLLDALHSCLKDRFFEQISIKDIAQHAGVSVGTFYRRFKDKESLLPLLYQDFGDDLSAWVSDMEALEFTSLRDVLEKLTGEMFIFLSSRKSVFRTIHLNARLHSELFSVDTHVDRRVIYKRLAAIMLRYEDEITANDKSKAADMVVFTLITTLLDKTIYPHLTPAVAVTMPETEFIEELPKLLFAYFSYQS
ncbi:TetR/AcrR family transcriptional regulator [Litorilituus lipolyticus]|uniref:TetR/AcrR family transcriptional regulator n=1 Tax=Litorilituus lipolyticus TaxID=2491017 RepID=A0A502KKM0_9GAMM|nr:TetR/AcrR family transcriptional regulator [Litorilituus lipolyticus]TPH12130.1 TetR/AcrR family transcriptional regulator [Litorilituus lipolyticus]